MQRLCKGTNPVIDRMRALTILASMAFVPFAAEAASVLDREYVAAGNNSLVISSNQPLAQSFSVGTDGLLDRVEVQIFRSDTSLTGTLTLSILEVNGGALGAALTSMTIAVADLPTFATFLSFDFADIDVDLGDTLAIRLTVDQPGGGNCTPACWQGDFPGLFDGGTGFAFDVPNARDFGFRTFIETGVTAVPAPPTLALAAVALAGIAFARRRTT